jgi:hypothetical protein
VLLHSIKFLLVDVYAGTVRYRITADAVRPPAVQAAGLEGEVAAAVTAVQSRLAGGLAAARGLLQEAQVSHYSAACTHFLFLSRCYSRTATQHMRCLLALGPCCALQRYHVSRPMPGGPSWAAGCSADWRTASSWHLGSTAWQRRHRCRYEWHQARRSAAGVVGRGAGRLQLAACARLRWPAGANRKRGNRAPRLPAVRYICTL